MTYTALSFANSPAFMEFAIDEALQKVAQANGQSLELTKEAFELQVPNVVAQVAKLVMAACEYCAAEANAGRLWK